ncbi:alpha-(1-_3)-arabinofuranosyltransferase [Nocardia nova]|uniref:alpha-(1->3)-arabinofuranosyltransferase n=1 Tax=Nocardia nova TaxID=37330 RepID=UPI001ED98BC1|nr:alpha-(1->3)-arabinofuranosyltransferase [Nocardia nova]
MGRGWLAGTVLAAFLLTFLQAPGLTVADTKYDLAQNPLGFLHRAAHLWSSQAPMGQVQNQAYGYFFPHGAFFSLGHILGLPAWATQRIWWALLILAGFWGIVRLCEVLGIGTRGSRVIAAVAFALSPRVLTTLGSISSETLPMMLAPWVLLAPAALGVVGMPRVPGASGWRRLLPRRPTAESLSLRGSTSPAASALALALMGSVNAVATVAAFLPAALWWASYRPNRTWWRFTRVWIPLLVLGTFWWVVPLLVLGKVSPPFLDYIESSGVTTQWASLGEVLRGTDSWTPYVSPERIAGAVLVTQPAAVLATGVLAAAGMAGLALRSMPARGRFTLVLIAGLVGICAGYAGELGGPFAESVRVFLDSGGAPLRNVHKLEPLIRIPLVIGLAHLLRRVPLPASVPMPVWRSGFAHPERNRMVAVAALLLAALTLSTSLAWTSKLAPRGAYDKVPAYWQETADWLAHNASDTRALVVPGAPFGSQIWGLTRDEPLQALASTPWAVRDAVPLTPPGAIRAMDSVQRLIADGRPSTGLAPTLIAQGIGVLVLRNDLDPDTSRSTRPMLAHQAIEGSPGISKVAEFGNPIEVGHGDGLVADGDLRPTYPAIEIYRVTADQPGTPVDIHSGPGAPADFPGARTVPLGPVPVVQGGPEVLERLRRNDSAAGPMLLAADAAAAGLKPTATTITDTPMDREADFGRVDNHNSALRAPTDARRTHNLVPDYPVPGAQPVEGQWSGATVTASSSAADATQLGGAAPGSSTAAAFDGDPTTAWLSTSAEHAVGQWLRLDLDHPIAAGALRVTTSPAAIGVPVKWMEVRTSNGTVAARITKPGEPVSISLPPGRTSWLTITATDTENGTAGGQFGISEVNLFDYSNRDAPVPVDIRHRTVLPPVAAGTPVSGWNLGQEFPGRSGCFDAPDRVRCSKGLALPAEEPGAFERTLSVPDPMTVAPQLTVRTRQGPALEGLLTDPERPVARGKADVGDLRGSAFAATDGDPRTSWIAPEETVRQKGGAKPTLTIQLPRPELVTGLEVTPPMGALPARPTSLAVNLGDGPQVREIPPAPKDRDPEAGPDGESPSGKTGGATPTTTPSPDAPAPQPKSTSRPAPMSAPPTPVRLELHPAVTDHIEISVNSWKPVLDRTALGFTQEQPPGLAEVSVLGPDYPAAAPGDRPVTVDCAHGPTIAVAGRVLHTSVTATADELRTGQPVPATVCPPDAESAEGTVADGAPQPVDLPNGSVDVTVVPTEMFSVDELRLDNTAFTATAAGATAPGNAENQAPSAGDSPPVGTLDPTPDGVPGDSSDGASQATSGSAPGNATVARSDTDSSPGITTDGSPHDAAAESSPHDAAGSSSSDVAGRTPGSAEGVLPSAIGIAPAARTGISASDGDRLLTLPLSTNVGWKAHTADGHTLAPVVVDGWKQGWVVPADAHGAVTVEFPIDRWYRLAIFGGLLLLIPLVLLAIPVPRRLRGLLARGKRETAADIHSTVNSNAATSASSNAAIGANSSTTNSTSSSAAIGDSAAISTSNSAAIGANGGAATSGASVSAASGHPDTGSAGLEPADLRHAESTMPESDSTRIATPLGPSRTPVAHRGGVGVEDHQGGDVGAGVYDPPPRTWDSWWLGAAGIAIAAFIIAGPVATVCAAAALAAVRFAPRAPFVLAATAGVGVVIAEAALSTGPWRSGTEYMGGSLWVQFPALVAVIALGVAALPARRRIRLRRPTTD